MDFDFIIKLRDLALATGGVLIDFLQTSVGDVLSRYGLGAGFLPESFLSVTFVEFLLAGGIVFIISYNLAKWLIPFLE